MSEDLQKPGEDQDVPAPRSNTLLKVVLILGVLIVLSCLALGGLGAVTYYSARSKAERALIQADTRNRLSQLRIAQEMYRVDNKKSLFAPDLKTLREETELRDQNSNYYDFEMETAKDGKSVTIYAIPKESKQKLPFYRLQLPDGGVKTADSESGPWK